MASVTRVLPALCLVLVLSGLGAPATAAGVAGQVDSPMANETRANDSAANTTAEVNATANVTVRNVTVRTGRSAVADRLTNRSAIERARDRGALRPDGRLFVDDTLVLELRMPGLDHRLAAADGPNETSRFFEATHGPESWVALRQTFDTTRAGINQAGVALNHANATSVVTDPENHTYYVHVDLTALPFKRVAHDESPFESEFRAEPYEGFAFYLELVVDGEQTIPGGDRKDDPHIELLADSSGQIELTGGGYLYGLESRRGVSIRVSGLPSGRNATIRISSQGDDLPVRERTVPITVTGDVDTGGPGRRTAAEATFNMSDFPAGAGLDITAVVDGATVAEETVESIRLDSFRIGLPSNQTWGDGSIRVRRVSLPENATLAARLGPWWESYADTAPIHGRIELDEGTHRNVTIPVRDESGYSPDSVTVFAVVDTNGNASIDGIDQYLLDDGFIAGKLHTRFPSDFLGVTTPLADGDDGSRSPSTAPTDDEPTEIATKNATVGSDATSTREGPGFGVLATFVAVVALIALGTRR